jgi:hypothetical protein
MMRCGPGSNGSGLFLLFEKILQYLRRTFSGQVSVDHIVDLHCRSQHTTPQAGHFFDRKQSGRIRILAVSNFQRTHKSFMDPAGSFDMTGGPDTDFYKVFSSGLKTELVIKGRNRPEHRRCAFGFFTEAFYGFGRQVSELVLNGLQKRQGVGGFAANPLYNGIHIA